MNPRSINPRTLLFALSVSLLFNLGFLAGWARTKPRPASPPVATAAGDLPLRDLELSREQRRRLIIAGRADRADRVGGIEAELRARESLRRALAAEPNDPQRVRSAVSDLAKVHEARSGRGQRVLVETVSILTDAQRQRLAARLAGEDYRAPRWKAVRDRFDLDHDGRLDAHERELAAAAAGR